MNDTAQSVNRDLYCPANCRTLIGGPPCPYPADLPYAADALEPHIDSTTMNIHHGKHHAGYVAKLMPLDGHDDLAAMALDDLISDLDRVPESIRGAIETTAAALEPQSVLVGAWPRCRRGTRRRTGRGDQLVLRFVRRVQDSVRRCRRRFGSGWAGSALAAWTLHLLDGQ